MVIHHVAQAPEVNDFHLEPSGVGEMRMLYFCHVFFSYTGSRSE